MTVRVLFDREFTVADIDRRVFGSFAEHMGRSIYEGIYEPGSAYADEDGLRTDVMDLVRELGVTIVRYPGGNFLSGYDWKDGVGPRENRAARLDLAWHSLETNAFGTDEFMTWCARTGIEPMMATNLGTGSLSSAVELLEYCNVEAPSRYARLREVNGHAEPYGVRTWCLGNEMDGPWQIGHQTADEYGRKAAEVANAMRMVDPDVELVACGSSGRLMPTFGTWEDRVLEHTYDVVDFLSLHQYYDPYESGSGDEQDLASFLGSGAHLESFITEVTAVADAVKARKRSAKTIYLTLDEWNVWSLSRHQAQATSTTWDVAPRLIEDTYTVADAVVVGDLLISILRHADRVRMACQAQLVNVIAPIRAEVGSPAWRQTIFHPFALTARHAQGTALLTKVDGPSLPTSKHGEVDQVSAVATYDEGTGSTSVFLVNRSLDGDVDVELHPRGGLGTGVPGAAGLGAGALTGNVTVTHTAVFDDDLMAVNVKEAPDRVVPKEVPVVGVADGVVRVRLPRASWNVVRIS